MKLPPPGRELLVVLRQLLQWTLWVAPVGILAGSASAGFLWLLDRVTEYRWQHPSLLYLLPLGGLVVGLIYHWIGRDAAAGNNLILDQIHTPGGGVPRRMAPLVLFGTLVTHLFGGSAGREGTAVQMGGSLASGWGRLFKAAPTTQRLLLLAGVAAGFGSVFGTPLTGAIFALEVLVIGRIDHEALVPVLLASVIGDATCSAWGIHHTSYHIDPMLPGTVLAPWDTRLILKIALAGIACGLVSRLFSVAAHQLQTLWKRICPWAPLRPVLGGIVVIALVLLLGTRDYLGLGVRGPEFYSISIVNAFHSGGTTSWSWAWKLIFTVVTVSSGFKGGEVTPLFFIGAALGNTLGVLMGAPVDLFAGIGFLAVFAGATNTPLACTVMGLELFGAYHTVAFALACFLAYAFSGHTGIYASQRIGSRKHADNAPAAR
jgi:H+/Cl- antiporter ClcA